MAKKEVVEQPKKKDEDWMTKKWRPMMAMMYMACCLADFFLFPIMFTVVQFWETAVQNDAFRQWVPITLQGGGLFHVAMGAVLGVSAYGRTQEKVAGAANVSTTQPAQLPAGLPTPSLSSSVPTPQPAAYNQYAQQNQYAPNQQYGSPGQNYETSSTVVTVVSGYGGKAAPPPAPQPLL
jgi:hypothetical protein